MRAKLTGTSQRYDPGSLPSWPGPQRLLAVGRIEFVKIGWHVCTRAARGRAALATAGGVPDGYLQASHRTMPPEGWDAFGTQVRALYERMAVITVAPKGPGSSASKPPCPERSRSCSGSGTRRVSELGTPAGGGKARVPFVSDGSMSFPAWPSATK